MGEVSEATGYNELEAELSEEAWVCMLAYSMFFSIQLNELGDKNML